MSSNITTARAAATILLIAGAPMALADAPTIDPADDAKHFGPLDRVMFWEPAQKVAGFRNAERLFLTRRIEAGDTPYPLPDSPVDLSPMQFEYRGESYGFADYIKKSNVAGLIVIQDGKVLDESYYLGNSRNTRWVSFSVTKSLTSMLLGAAIEDGYIGDLDEAITDYLPRLKGSLYDGVTIRNLLQMASGIDWNEDYEDPQSDVNTYPWYDVLALFGYLDDKQRVAAPGAEFRYNSAETDLVGSVVRAAIGNNLSTYLEKKIWKPFGMESDTNWLLGAAGGAEIGGCCVSATLRDYARIGLFALRGGELPDGTRVLPSGWMRESTTPSAAFRGYGFLWWLNDDGSYEARGVFGQTVYINPRLNLVIAKHAVWDKAFD
ncbi:MAG: beta-lactamase family protein, partial [Gammaproteobacteria bacterium]|nr:beta-lactamase family protein [Gammaproteobacteria bacterium]